MSIHSKREEPADPNAIRPLSPTIRILVIVGELLLASLFLPLVALFPGVLVEREPGPFVVIGVGCLVAAYGLGLQRRWMVPASVAMVAISGYTLLRALDAISKSAGWGVVLLTIVPLNGIAVVFCLLFFGVQIAAATVAFNSLATKNFPGKIRWWAETVEVVLVLILIPSAMIFDFTAPARFQEEWRANRDAALDREIERREADHADFERRNQIQRDFLNEWANSRTSGNDDLHEGTTQVLIDRLETRLIFPTVLHDFILQTDSESRSEILDLTRSLSDPYRSLENLGDRGAEAERFLPILDRIGASDPHPTVAKSAKKSAQWIRQRVQEDNKLPPSARRERFG